MYTWNAEDRLIEATTPDGAHWHYAYDPLGRRISKHRQAPDGIKTDRTNFAWDETRLSEQTGPDGKATTWDYPPDTHRPLTQTDHKPPTATAGTSFLARLAEESDPGRVTRFHAVITDSVGTPTELVSEAGDLVWRRHTTLRGIPLPAPVDEETVHCPLGLPNPLG